MKILENIREIRMQKGIKQEVIASAFNLDTSVVSNIETGKRKLRVEELEILANALGVSVIDLFTWPVKYVPANEIGKLPKTILQVELTKDKQEQVLRLVFGENYSKLL